MIFAEPGSVAHTIACLRIAAALGIVNTPQAKPLHHFGVKDYARRTSDGDTFR